jgi:hypothetical protein
MKSSFAPLSTLVTMSALLALSATAARAAEMPEVVVTAHVPHTAAARASADLIARAEHALRGVSNLWIFPTGDATSVFVQYEMPAANGAAPQRQLALVEMRGERIARMIKFAPMPPALETLAARN